MRPAIWSYLTDQQCARACAATYVPTAAAWGRAHGWTSRRTADGRNPLMMALDVPAGVADWDRAVARLLAAQGIHPDNGPSAYYKLTDAILAFAEAWDRGAIGDLAAALGNGDLDPTA